MPKFWFFISSSIEKKHKKTIAKNSKQSNKQITQNLQILPKVLLKPASQANLRNNKAKKYSVFELNIIPERNYKHPKTLFS